MAKGYRPVDRDQQFLMPPDMREWLPADHPVWLVIAAVGQLDTSAVHAHRRTGGVGRAGYHPDMLLTLLMWAWAQGVRSSRRIERACEQDVAFRVICAGDVPDHVTISRFRAEAAASMESVFEQVLILCATLGMAGLGVVALDGVKIGSNASMSANRTEEGLVKAGQDERDRQAAAAVAARAAAREAAAEHAAADAADDDLFGPDDRGDQVPPDAVDPSSREIRIAAALADLQAEKDAEQAAAKAKGDAYLALRESGHTVQGSRPPPGVDVQIARDRLARAIAEREEFIADYWRRRRAAEAAGTRNWGRLPRPVEQHQGVIRCRARLAKAEARQAKRDAAQAKSRRVRNTTDPESRMMPLRGGGWLQGYNCQAVTSTDGLIIAVSVNNNPSDVITYIQMTDAAVKAAELIDQHRPTGTGIGIMVSDAGYLSAENLTAPGPDRLIAVGKAYAVELDARTNPEQGPPPDTTDPIEAMGHRLRTPEGIATYRQRSHIAETPFGHGKHNLGFRRFTGRGLIRAAAEWNFHGAVHNLFKAISTGHLTPATYPNTG
ncbi:MAG TPA: transposase [Nakamurella sp.]|nr:transposase [Nakamurella sp.]